MFGNYARSDAVSCSTFFCILYYMKLRLDPSSFSVWHKYRWWIIGFCAVSLVFVCAGAFSIIKVGDEGSPTNFETFYFVAYITKESGFFACLLQRLLFNLAIWGLCMLVVVNKWLIRVSCLGFWYGCYIMAINIFAIIGAYGVFNIFLLLLALIVFMLGYVFACGVFLFSLVNRRVNHSPCNPLSWLVIFALLGIIEMLFIMIVAFFIIIIV